MPPRHTHVPPVQNNQPGTGFGSRGKLVGLVPSVTPLGKLSAPRMGARGAIWAHIQIHWRASVRLLHLEQFRMYFVHASQHTILLNILL